jgi:hypothetical protein
MYVDVPHGRQIKVHVLMTVVTSSLKWNIDDIVYEYEEEGGGSSLLQSLSWNNIPYLTPAEQVSSPWARSK